MSAGCKFFWIAKCQSIESFHPCTFREGFSEHWYCDFNLLWKETVDLFRNYIIIIIFYSIDSSNFFKNPLRKLIPTLIVNFKYSLKIFLTQKNVKITLLIIYYTQPRNKGKTIKKLDWLILMNLMTWYS